MRKIKKLLMTMALLPLMALADTETVDGITWTYTITNGEATVGNGRSCAIPPTTAGAITIPSYLGGCPVTAIGNNAFAELWSFEGIMVQGEEDLKGFGTYDATSFYPVYDRTGKKTGEKAYKYKESVPVSFGRE